MNSIMDKTIDATDDKHFIEERAHTHAGQWQVDDGNFRHLDCATCRECDEKKIVELNHFHSIDIQYRFCGLRQKYCAIAALLITRQ